MDLREGYKQTDVGIIPIDWDVAPLNSVCKMKSGEGITSSSIDETSNYPVYGGNGLRGYTQRFTHNGNYALIGRQGALCGNVMGVRGKFFASEHAIVVTADDKTDIGWLTYVLDDMQLNQYSESSAQPGLSVAKILRLNIPYPSTLAEQQAIAEALSDVDALIEALEQLIAKKRPIKQGAMQELLTGKRRLPGFETLEGQKQTEVGNIPADWEIKHLSHICESITDGTHFTPKYVDSGIPFYSVENVNANDFANPKYISKDEHQRLIRRCKPEHGDILMTRIGSLGDTKLIDWDINASIYVSLALLKPNSQILTEYLYQFTKSRSFVQGIERRSLLNASPKKINMDAIGLVPVAFPPTLAEQSIIAEVLGDMEEEIARLGGQLLKTRLIKQGMMQELLTGRIRLI